MSISAESESNQLVWRHICAAVIYRLTRPRPREYNKFHLLQIFQIRRCQGHPLTFALPSSLPVVNIHLSWLPCSHWLGGTDCEHYMFCFIELPCSHWLGGTDCEHYMFCFIELPCSQWLGGTDCEHYMFCFIELPCSHWLGGTDCEHYVFCFIELPCSHWLGGTD